ncbi:MAG: alpha/beta hydrolase [Pseudomonadota bacterium]|nr:alpha/beta hydrolase [Pseudomonadota bacterium]
MIKTGFEQVRSGLRRGLFQGLERAGHRPGKTIPGLNYGDAAEQALDLYLPADGPCRARVMFIHGGAWHSGHRSEYAFLGAALAAHRVACAVVGYRLYPQVRYPAFVHDVAQAVVWLQREGHWFGLPPGPLYLMGHSAGAHIACLVALNPQFRPPEPVPDQTLAGVIGIAGVYRFRPETSPLYSQIFAPAAPDFTAVKPIHFVGRYPLPLLLLHGDKDRVIAARNARQMVAAADAAGQEAELQVLKGYGHIRPLFDFLPFIPNHQRTMATLLSFMTRSRPCAS